MQYIISFLEGIITFISPCLLPMLPIYISYFAGGGERTTGKTLKNASGFVLGFTLVFVALGALAGTLGSFLTRYQSWVNIIGGGSQNQLLNRLTIRHTGKKLITGPTEGTAIGNLLMQMIGRGEICDIATGREIVKRSFDIKTH